METLRIIAIVTFATFALSTCSQKRTLSQSDETIKDELNEIEATQAKAANTPAEEDSIWKIPYYTANLEDAINYFRKNNKYKDWDPKNGKRTLLSAVIEKDGTPTSIIIRKTSGIKELDEEAVRLVGNAKISPAKDENQKPLRSEWFISIPFPPQ